MSTYTMSTEPADPEAQQREQRYRQAVALVIAEQKAPLQFLKTRLGVEMAEAIEILDRMENEGIVGPPLNGRARDVLKKELPASAFPTTGEQEPAPAALLSSPPRDEATEGAFTPPPVKNEERKAKSAHPAVMHSMGAELFPADPAEIQPIPAERLVPSPTNPRKTFPEAELKELAASIAAQGLISPLVVRPLKPDAKGARYEVVAGARRLHACRILGWPAVPCIVRQLSDVQVIELQIVENLQRQDLHPMDEALGYRALLDLEAAAGGEQDRVEAIAKKLGKSSSYVYQRLKLADLQGKARQAFLENKITTSHAVDCARLQPGDQQEYIDRCLDGDAVSSVRAMRQWIGEEIRKDLGKAPFSLQDAELVPAAGACSFCPKMTGSNPALFDGLGPEPQGKRKSTKPLSLCLDPKCYREKLQAFVKIQAAKLAASARERGEKRTPVVEVWGGDHFRQPYDPHGAYDYRALPSEAHGDFKRSSPGACKSTEPAIVVGGKDVGETFYICANRKCSTHYPKTETRGSYAGDTDRWRKVEAERARKREIEQEARRQALRELRAKLTGQIPRLDLEVVALAFYKRLAWESQAALHKALGWELARHGGCKKIQVMQQGELCRFLVSCAVAEDLRVPSYGGNLKLAGQLASLCKRYRVNLDGIRARLAAAAKAKPHGKPKTTAQKKGGKR